MANEATLVDTNVLLDLVTDDPRWAGWSVRELERAALFLAGKAFLDYRRRGGGRSGVLPDFFIGAHAAVAGLTLLTRDAGRYRGYFPSVEVMAPH